MKKTRGIRKILSLVIASLTTMAFSAAPAEGDIEAGRTKSVTCAACHGPDGNSVVPEWPKLAGQHASYLTKQLKDFKSGTRKNPVMSPLVTPFGDQDIQDLSAYFASQKRNIGAADPKLVKAGELLYRGGNMETGLPACMACHGPAGSGNPAAGFPALDGQHAVYTATQLRAYQSGERNGDPASMMRTIAAKMTEEEIESVSSYIEGLH
jgi:cytochrome c553